MTIFEIVNYNEENQRVYFLSSKCFIVFSEEKKVKRYLEDNFKNREDLVSPETVGHRDYQVCLLLITFFDYHRA